MKSLNTGTHYGTSKSVRYINGLTIVNSVYHNQTSCPWHYHSNAHFAYTTYGNLIETHQKQKLHLSVGCLMYNHSQEPHHNSGYSEFVSALHIDVHKSWFDKYGFKTDKIEGVHILKNPILKNLFINLLKEVKINDAHSPLTIESLIVEATSGMLLENKDNSSAKPSWVYVLRDLLHSFSDPLTLEEVAKNINIHPVYLCQQFPVYFHCSFGDYIRKIKIEKAVVLMLAKPHTSLTQIGYECGFADQSHFIRLFKKYVGINPLAYKKLLSQ